MKKIDKKKDKTQTNFECILDELKMTQQIVKVIRRLRLPQYEE